MQIEPTGFLTYLVKGKYTVDLAANDCRGQCDCGRHRCVVQPAWNRHEEMDACKHVRECQIYAWKHIAPAIVGKWEKPQHWHGTD